jgi:tRNA threonylcarbamoyladenosine biosynthesis protein TsaB
MLVLALDTTTRQGSSALVRGGRLIGACLGDAARTHAERLPADLIGLLGAHSLTLGEVDVFAVAAGPGSFTGLRVGIATIQGLAFATGRRVVPVSTLEALGQVGAGWNWLGDREPEQPGTIVGVLMDAQRREVFSALYRVVPDVSHAQPARHIQPISLETIDLPAAEPPATTLGRWSRLVTTERLILVGDGALRYCDEIARQVGNSARILDPLPPLAPFIGAMAEGQAEAGLAVMPHVVRPIYVRRPDAELARERRDGPPPGSVSEPGCA